MSLSLPLCAQDTTHTKTHKTENVILVISDGFRWQEFFKGANPEKFTEVNQVTTPSLLQAKFGADTPAERRERLLPFIWTTAVKDGQFFGNRDLGSDVHVTNDKWFSYPGYNELITGHPDPKINSNRAIPNHNTNVFEWLNKQPELNGKVAVFGAWSAFPAIFNSTRSKLHVVAGKGDPYDGFKNYLEKKKPRVMFLGFGATDHQAHKGNYPNYLDAAHRVDYCLGDLWNTLQSMPQYKDKTTIIFTADHGRGNTMLGGEKAWNSHGRKWAGSNSLFLAIWGPDTPNTGEIKNGPALTQSQVAATLAAVMGYDYDVAQSKAGKPITEAISGENADADAALAICR